LRAHSLIAARRLAALLVAAALPAVAPAAARAQAAPAQPNVSWARDGVITGAAIASAALAALIPVDTQRPLWQTQLLPFDRALEGRLSQSASSTSDTLAAIDVVTPLALLVGQGGVNSANGRRVLVYGEAIAVGVALNAITKGLVGRPRPYTYSDDPRIRAYAARQGKDSRLSFFSGHATTTFAAAVAGSYVYSQMAADRKERAAVWGFELVLAGATSDLRTRAGKHFYSDVIAGAIVGAAVGFGVPRLHGGPAYAPSAPEWIVIAAAPVAGVVIGQLLSARADVIEPLSPAPAVAIPWVAPGGGGVMLARLF
jgi:membrane-associated phospholipid phosphatase